MLNKAKWTRVFRRLGMMHLVDRMKYSYLKVKNRKINQSFKQAHPEVKFPPDYLMFESFQLDYRRYFEGGRESAQWLKNHMLRHISLQNQAILDWGCGPARIVRHLPELINGDCRFFGTDYNATTIAWCKANIPGVQFSHNQLVPPTKYSDNFFDVVYGISIFTHLSEINHRQWLAELIRITKPGGLLLLTMQGRAFREKLSATEQRLFDAGQLVVRGNVVEGHRVFSAFHPPDFVEGLFSGKARILEHTEGSKQSWGIEQDLWAISKLS